MLTAMVESARSAGDWDVAVRPHHERLDEPVRRPGLTTGGGDDPQGQTLAAGHHEGQVVGEAEAVLAAGHRGDQRGSALGQVELHVEALVLAEALVDPERDGSEGDDGEDADVELG